jgi:hypothetical protein
MAGLTDEEVLRDAGAGGSGEPLSDEDVLRHAGAGTKLLDRRGEDDSWGAPKNVTTGVAKAVTHVPGFFGDLRELPAVIGSNIQSIWEPGTAPEIRQAYMKRQAEALDKAIREGDWGTRTAAKLYRGSQAIQPPSGQDVYNATVKPLAGEYDPTTTLGKYGQIALESAVPLPGGKAKMAEAILPYALGLVDHALKALGKFKTPAIGAGLGVASAAAGDLTGTEGGALIGGALPFAAKAAHATVPRSATDKFARWLPQTKEWAAQQAAKYMLGPSDPEAALRTATQRYASEPPELGAKGFRPNIAEAAEDRGLAGTEQAVRVMRDPEIEGRMQQQANARLEGRNAMALSTLDPHVAPEAVTAFYLQRQEAMDRALEAAAPGSTLDPSERGKAMKDVMTSQKASARAMKQAKQNAVDPDKNLIINMRGGEAAEQAKNMIAAHERDLAPGEKGPEHLPQLRAVAGYTGDVPLQTLWTRRARLNRAIEKATSPMTPDTHAVGELTTLRKALDRDIANSYGRQQEQHLAEIAAGTRAPGDTAASHLSNDFSDWLKREQSEWAAARASVPGATGGAGTRPNTAGNAGPIHGMEASGSPPGGGQAHGANGSGVAGTAPADPDAAARLAASTAFTRFYHQRFSEGVPGDILHPRSDVTLGDVSKKVFPGGANGLETTRHVLESAGKTPEGMAAMHDIAVSSLRDVIDGNSGRLTPKALDKWRNTHGGSLRAMDEVTPGYSDRFNNVANVQSELATKMAGFKDTASAARELGSVAASPQGPAKIADLLREAGGSHDVREGIRNLLVSHLVDTATTRPLMRGAKDQFSSQKFLNTLERIKPTLAQVADPHHIEVLEKLARDFESEMAHNQRLSGTAVGSQTTPNQQLLNRVLGKEPAHPGAGAGHIGGLAPYAFIEHGIMGGATVVGAQLGTRIMSVLAHAGHSRNIRNMQDAIKAIMTDPDIGMAALRHHVGEQVGSASWSHRVKQALDKSPYYALPDVISQQEEKRQGHAAGGSVKVDHAAHAARLVRLVAEARKMTSEDTKPMLKLPDATVSRALAIANERLA